MAIKNFNAKKMLMSTLAAVVFSFVFTTSANAEVSAPANAEVSAPQKSNVGVRVKADPKSNLEIRVKDAPNQFEKLIEQILGIRVRVRV